MSTPAVTSTRNPRRAFTLLEVMLAIALLVILSGGVAAFAWNIIDARARVLHAADRERAAGAVFEALERALAVATLAGEGFTAETASIRLAMRDTRAGLDDGLPELARRAFELRFNEPDQQLTLTLGREADHLPAAFERLRIRCFDGREWLDRFDAAELDRLPAAVEVALWYAPSPRDAARAQNGARPGLEMNPQNRDPEESRFEDDPFGVAAAVRVPMDELGAGVTRPPDRVRVFALLDPGSPESGLSESGLSEPGLSEPAPGGAP